MIIIYNVAKKGSKRITRYRVYTCTNYDGFYQSVYRDFINMIKLFVKDHVNKDYYFMNLGKYNG